MKLIYKIDKKDDVTLLKTKIPRATHHRSNLKYVVMFNGKVVVTISDDKGRIF